MRFVVLALSAVAAAEGILASDPNSWQVLRARQYDTGTPSPPLPPASCNISEADREALDYEFSNYVNGPASNDSFYSALPPNASDAAPGDILKVEHIANSSLFTLPPTTSISRFIYVSETLGGRRVPVSAYVLWPFAPRSQPDGKYPVVGFAHGTSGFSANCGPSNIRNLWQHYLAPFALAAQGYVVVGTDYAGLGVSRYPNGDPIVHPYAVSPAHANDVVYSVLAAQKAFPQLSKDWVAMGHSQGGGAAWAVAQRQVHQKIKGYLGAVAISPLTTLLDVTTDAAGLLGLLIAPGVQSIFPELNLLDVATPAGLNALSTLSACGGCLAVAFQLLGALTEPLRPNYRLNPTYVLWQSQVITGGLPIAEPMFVAHGTADPLLNFNLTERAVGQTRSQNRGRNIEFMTLQDAGHVPALQASQAHWMDWIAARFRRERACNDDITINHLRPTESLSQNINWYIRLATEAYEIA